MENTYVGFRGCRSRSANEVGGLKAGTFLISSDIPDNNGATII